MNQMVYENKSNKDDFNLLKLIGKKRLLKMQQRFYDVTGFANACLDGEGVPLCHAGPEEPVCMDMIRKNPVGNQRCRRMVEDCLEHVKRDKSRFAVLTCHAGMLHALIPIEVEGNIAGVLAIGQLFEEHPDKEQALNYARALGMAPLLYWDNLQKVKIVSREKLEYAAMLLEFMASEIAGMASANFRLKKEIDARKKAEAEISQINKALNQERNMFVSGNVVVFKWKNGPGWPVEYVSSNVEQVFGYEDCLLLSGEVSYSDIISPEDLDRVVEEVDFHTDNGSEHFSHEPYRVIRKDGRIIWIDDYTTVLRNAQNQVTHYLGYVVDISRRKQAEKKLYMNYQFIHSLLETIPNPVFYKDSKGSYLGCNQAFERFVGQSRGEIIGKSVYDMASRDIAEKYDLKDQELLQNPGDQSYEWKVQSSDGHEKDVIFNKAAFFDEKGNVGGIIGVITDITQRKKIEEEREALIGKLQKALSEIKQLSGLLPICSSCKKIRDDEGYWYRIEAYIQEHSNARFTHGICPSCMDKLYGQESWYPYKK